MRVRAKPRRFHFGDRSNGYTITVTVTIFDSLKDERTVTIPVQVRSTLTVILK